ncbi:MAG: hypothetical protein WC661_16725 [Opitutaceae bacterium]|jgi:hypothetical protein
MKQTKLILAGVSLFLAGAIAAQAQSDSTTTTATTTTTNNTTTTSSYNAADEFGPVKGSWEFTLGGSGGSNKELNNSLGGANASLGYYLTNTLEVSVRQSANYTNDTGNGGANYDGSFFAGIDQHFGTGRLRPFVGVNFGRLYGDSTNDTWAAGIEGGLKFYVLPKTFLFALANYAWTFDDSDKATDNFDDGAFLWSVGVGFNF